MSRHPLLLSSAGPQRLRQLILAVTGFDVGKLLFNRSMSNSAQENEDAENIQLCLDFTTGNLLHHRFPDTDEHQLQRRYEGHV